MSDDTRIDARNAVGVQIGEGNTQIVYQYAALTWGDGVTPPPLTTVSGHVESPYRGLASYDERDAAFFFGREDTTEEVLARLSARLHDETAVVVVSGASGAGKSSLIRAGVLPRLRGAGLIGAPEASGWPCLLFRPGPQPLDELALELGELAGLDAAGVRATLTAEPAAAALTARQAVRRRARNGIGRLVLAVDQFEQLFVQCEDPGDRIAFLAALRALATGPSAPAIILLGIRADFEARCAEEELLTGAVQDRYLVTSLTPRQLRAAITEPARVAGGVVEPALVDTLLAEQDIGAAAGFLPLLSHALDQAWRRRIGPALTITDYERAGGVHGAVAATAQATYDGLSPDQQQLAKDLFLRLTVTDADGRDVSMRMRRSDLHIGHDQAAADLVVEAFTAERLLTVGADTVELSHEALLSAWPLLRDEWLAESRSRRLVLSRLRLTAGEWDRHERDPAYLYAGSLLDTSVAATHEEHLAPVDQQFLNASVRRRRAATNWRRAVAAGLVAICVALAGVALIAVRAQQDATRQRDEVIGNTLVQQSQDTADSDPGLSKLESVAAWRTAPSPTTYGAMLEAAERPGVAALTGHAGAVNAIGVDASGRTAVSVGDDGTLRVWDLMRRRQIAVLQRARSPLYAVAISPDGRLVATGGPDRTIRVYNIQTKRQIGTWRMGSEASSAAFSPSGSSLAVATTNRVGWWNVRTRQPIRTVRIAQDFWHLSYNPNGNDVAVGGENTGEVLRVAPTGSIRVVVKASGSNAHPTPQTVWDVAYSPGGGQLAVAFPSNLRIFDLNHTTVVATLPIHARTVVFTPDGQRLITGLQEGNVWITQLTTTPANEICNLTGATGISTDVAVTASGTTAVTSGGDGVVRVWALDRVPCPTRILKLRGGGGDAFDDLAWQSRRGPVMSVSGDSLQRWDPMTGKSEGVLRIPGLDQALLLPVGPRAVVTTSVNRGYELKTIDLNTGAAVIVYRGRGSPDELALSPDGHEVAVAVYGKRSSTELVPLTGGHPRVIDTDQGRETTAIAFSPDGRLLAVAGTDSALELWDVASGRRVARTAVSAASVKANDQTNELTSVSFSPDGRSVATGDVDTRVRIWSIVGDRLRGPRALPQTSAPLITVAFDPSGKFIAAGGLDGNVSLWNPTTGRPIDSEMRGPTDAVLRVAFSPDGHWLASAGKDDRLILWDTSTLRDPSRSLCEAAGSNLTRTQWRSVVGNDASYRQPCP